MDFLGMGPLEIILVLIVAFLFFGPEKLPGMAAKAGEWYRKLTRTTSDMAKTLTNEVKAELESTPVPEKPAKDTGASKTAVVKDSSTETPATEPLTLPETGKNESLPGEKTGK
jgi:sec-independent protein translocase protein TatB